MSMMVCNTPNEKKTDGFGARDEMDIDSAAEPCDATGKDDVKGSVIQNALGEDDKGTLPAVIPLVEVTNEKQAINTRYGIKTNE